MNKKGFTLIELLASLVILGILSTIAVSSVLSVIERSRKELYVEDAKKFASQIEYNVRANKYKLQKPTNGNCIAVSLKYIDSSDFKKAPGGGKYDLTSSFVVLKNQNYEDKYYIRLVERLKNTSVRGISMANLDDLKKSKGADKVTSLNGAEGKDLFTVDDSVGSKAKILALLPANTCNNLTVYYE